MTPPSRRILLTCALSLCAVAGTALFPRGFCSRGQCFAVFQEPMDFRSARGRCKHMGAQLLDRVQLEPLLHLLQGDYWVWDRLRYTEGESGNCSSVSVTGTEAIFLDQSCAHYLDGFVCQLRYNRDSCTRLQLGGDSQVTFTSVLGFPLQDVFPRGTVAVVRKPDDGAFPVSKHTCISKRWLRAPWSCEVNKGGCEHNCTSQPPACLCPAGTLLHPNSISCTEDPCVSCAHGCVKKDGVHECKCEQGYRLSADQKSCVDVDECAVGKGVCVGEGEVCVNTEGGFQCQCAQDFQLEDGACVNMSICMKCEQKCVKVQGVHTCVCLKGFQVSRTDTNRCEQVCAQEECAAHCVQTPDMVEPQCFCPLGFIHETWNDTHLCVDIDECYAQQLCQHSCHNNYGSFTCSCPDGYELYESFWCRAQEEGPGVHGEGPRLQEEEEGPGPVAPTAARVHPTAVPSYVKTGSVLGMAVFAVLCAGVLYLLVLGAVRRCSKMQLYSFKQSEQNLFTLQQVSTETYKRLDD